MLLRHPRKPLCALENRCDLLAEPVESFVSTGVEGRSYACAFDDPREDLEGGAEPVAALNFFADVLTGLCVRACACVCVGIGMKLHVRLCGPLLPGRSRH